MRERADAVLNAHAPLAERMRPRTLDEVVGQAHVLGPGSPLRVAMESGRIPSIVFWGPPGVGKTTFVQGLARGFGLTEPITSPTFTIFTLHRGKTPSSRTLIHLDAYRLERADQLDSLMLDDFLTPPYCLAVEWPENIAAWLPPQTLHFELGILPDERHTLRLR
eukprot:gene36092-48578_t